MIGKSKVKNEISGLYTIKLKKDDILCRAGEDNSDLYLIHRGRLMIFVVDGTKVTPIAYLEKDEYVGELSFFDGQKRSAFVVAVEDTDLIEIPVSEAHHQFPDWLLRLAKFMTKTTREMDETFRTTGIKRKNVESIAPLSIEEQRHYYQLSK